MNAIADLMRPQRSTGRASVAIATRRGRAAIAGLHQAGSAKAMYLPGAGGPEVVFLNTSGGLTGRDRLRYALDLGSGLRATATTQTAERAYRAVGDPAHVRVRHSVGAGAHLDWLPQETILFQGARLRRETQIDLTGDATCLLLEAVVLGRAAMGERVSRLEFTDRRMISRDGVPLFAEPLRLTGEALAAGAAVLAGARAIATLVLVAPDAADRLEAARAILDEPGVRAGASAFDGKLVVRLMAGDGWPLRRQILRALAVLRPGRLPRVWQT
ncbi:urease accessory protein [Salinihabitans flavidus]|uniref:Urease accessory protein UreD n=1 Tax=Salinihabitans flavidus TaxID=569882 RepID=A0A1H8MGH7_9RHOB|nr:urease accessory protein UreD [Salinihabitans flavidus]SEO16491.1 urease accessory protein [Salinihabitans flavidus]